MPQPHGRAENLPAARRLGREVERVCFGWGGCCLRPPPPLLPYVYIEFYIKITYVKSEFDRR